MRRPTNPWGAALTGRDAAKAPKPEEPPAPRNHAFEQRLCEAIRARVVVRLRYEDDVSYRTFEPIAVYPSSKHKECVIGRQLDNPAEPAARNVVKNFEVGKITALEVTAHRFTPDPRFNRNDKRYQNGIRCSIWD